MALSTTGGYPSNDKIKFYMALSQEFYYTSLALEVIIAILSVFLFALTLWKTIKTHRLANSEIDPNEAGSNFEANDNMEKTQAHLNNKIVIHKNRSKSQISRPSSKFMEEEQPRTKGSTVFIGKRNVRIAEVQSHSPLFRRQLAKKDKKTGQKHENLQKETPDIITFQEMDEEDLEKSDQKDSSQISDFQNGESDEEESHNVSIGKNIQSDAGSINLENLSQRYVKSTNMESPSEIDQEFHEDPRTIVFQLQEDQAELMECEHKFSKFENRTLYLVCLLSLALVVLNIVKVNFITAGGVAIALLNYAIKFLIPFKKRTKFLNLGMIGFVIPLIAFFDTTSYLQ